MVLQVVLRLLQTNHCPLSRQTVPLKLGTVRFSAYLITRCSNVRVIWWHTPVIAYGSAVVLWHNRQQESAKCHWVSLRLLLLSAQKDKPVFHFLCILLVHLSFRKKKPSSFFCTALSESLWTCYLWPQRGRAVCCWCHRPRDLATSINRNGRDQGQKLQHGAHWPKASCHWLAWKPRPWLCGSTRSRKATNARQQQTGNTCVWAEACRDTHSLRQELLLILWCCLYILTLRKQWTCGAVQLTSKHWDQNNFTAVFWITFLLAAY